MCGICGFYSKNKRMDLRESLSRVRSLLLHRGPDAEGFFQKDNIGLAVLRLSIVDVEGSNQPLYNEDNSVVLVYNGMIYNYKELRSDLSDKGHNFRTRGDGEVILHLYEEKSFECFKFLHGMFSLALYDIKRDLIVLARDHVGIKPLYYCIENNAVLFSSEIKGLIKTGLINDDLDLEGLSLYFSYNYVPGDKTIYKNIFELLPGHFLKIDSNFNLIRQEFWNLSDKRNSSHLATGKLSLEDIGRDLEGLLSESIEKHMQSDVEIGCFLSGGLDSSTLVHLLAERSTSRIKTFSVGYDNIYYDELQYARIVSEKNRTEHREIICTKDDAIDFLEKLSEIGDSPVAEQSSVSMFLVSKLASKYVKVCFSGEGADELFLGYPTYFADFLYPLFRYAPANCLSLIERLLRFFPASDKKVSFDYQLLRFVQGLKFRDFSLAHAFWRVIFSENEKIDLFKNDFLSQVNNLDIKSHYFARSAVNINSGEFCANADLQTLLPFNHLSRTDIYSMRNSLEVRVPFLYLPLVEYLIQLPFKLRFNPLKNKYLLKKIMRDKVDAKIIKRKKQGWHMPLGPWLKSELFNYTQDIFSSKHRLFDNFIKREECMDLLIKHKKQKSNNAFKIWNILVLLKNIKP